MIEFKDVTSYYLMDDARADKKMNIVNEDIKTMASEKNYRVTLREVSFKADEGECIAFIGHSGCGKTTLVRLINGLIPDCYRGGYTGDIMINSTEGRDLNIWRRGRIIASVFQGASSQFFAKRIEEEIAFACENYGFTHRLIRECTSYAMNRMSLNDIKYKSLRTLSDGERQRLSIASAIALRPKIIIFDEPSLNLDAESLDSLIRVIAELKKEGMTIIITEQRIGYLKSLVDRYYYLSRGRIEKVIQNHELEGLEPAQLVRMNIRSKARFTDSILPEAERRPIYINNKPVGLRVENINFITKNKHILRNLSFSVAPGQIVAITGKNGSGKTSLGRIIAGLRKESSGSILIDGKSIPKKDRHDFVWISTNEINTQFFTESVTEELLLGMERKSESYDNVKELMILFNLYDKRHKHPYALSLGEKQRLSIACGLLSQRQVLIFDEPSSGLDLRNMKNIAEAIRFAAGTGKIILIITHDYEMIRECCTHELELIGLEDDLTEVEDE